MGAGGSGELVLDLAGGGGPAEGLGVVRVHEAGQQARNGRALPDRTTKLFR